MYCISEILNNTFVGTLLAGSFLAMLGLKLYRWQKAIDIKYDDFRKTREQASTLFAQVEIATKNFEAQVNIYNVKNRELHKLSEILNNKFDNHFQNEFEDEFNSFSKKITASSDDLIAQLKINNNYDNDIELLSKNIPIFNLYLLGTIVLRKYTKEEDIEEFAAGFRKVSTEIRSSLAKIINTSL